MKLKFWLQSYSKKIMEIKRGNGLRPQYIVVQHIVGTAGESERGIIGDGYGHSPTYPG